MAKSSFATQLAKGFIRSAVNQVGRDGGRVISNRMYGNSFSAPVRVTDGYSMQNQEGRSYVVDEESVVRQGIYSSQIGGGKMVLFAFLSLMFGPLAVIAFIIMWWTRRNSTSDNTFVKMSTPFGPKMFPAPETVVEFRRKSASTYLIFAGVALAWTTVAFLV